MIASRLPKPTVFRLVVLLEHAGMVARKLNGKRYTVGPRLSTLALDIIMNSPMRGVRHAILQRLVEEIGETCNLTMLGGHENAPTAKTTSQTSSDKVKARTTHRAAHKKSKCNVPHV